MGNHTGKDSHNSTGSPLDFFHTPPTTPSEAELNAMASASSSNEASPETAGCTTPFTTSPIADWTHKVPAPTEWAVISVDSITSSETNVSDAAVGQTPAASLPPSRGSPAEQSWQERDSGLEPQAATERAGEEMTLVLLSLMEHYQNSLGLTPNRDVTTGAVELLRHLITERDTLDEEVHTLKETLRTEQMEWHQFQCDLQVAVSVADRLRVESEQALDVLQGKHRAVEDQLAQAISRQQEKDKELESLRAEYREVCRKLSELTLQQQQDQAELEALRRTCRDKDMTTGDKDPERQDSLTANGEEKLEEAEDDGAKHAEKENEEAEEGAPNAESTNGTGSFHLTGKGVAEGYLRSLAALEKKKEDGRGLRDPRRIVMLSERSWSLSRLPLPSDSSTQNETSKNLSTTLPLCKKEEPTKGRRMDRVLQRQDSWSSFYTGKQEEDQSSDSVKMSRLYQQKERVASTEFAMVRRHVPTVAPNGLPRRLFSVLWWWHPVLRPQDGFSALLRRHGGSRRNSLLRWSQSRTQGYENIEITNFSSSWEDGLAFCAVYHTYLPTRIPYDSLSPEDKRDNLDLAFKTGESVGIPATLTVEEMLKPNGPDWQRVLAYVESIFRHFEM
ncbi:cytospin-A-like isoform X1 [Sphaeramia orbicularis]|uniref:cytospin-A-like isoform X1 n=1 Tax=Sphaeramia orbicularis TaxID=375764 RepID=UPI00117CB9CD|nr:cytospin-A-like isoform X1 [Sphaeramia orbicularis]